MADTNLDIIVQIKDGVTKGLQSIRGELQNHVMTMENMTKASQAVATGFVALGASVGTLGGFAIKAAADAEQTRISFNTMLGDAEVAGNFIKDLVAFAAKTPFTLKGLETASKQLLAYGIQQKDILPDLKALGDIAAGVGMDKLPNLIMAFGQVNAKTKLMGDDLRQFTEAGIPLLDMLAKQYKKTVPEIQEMVSAGQIGFPAVEQALKSLSGEGGRFNNLMEKQAGSLSGMWSNLQDAWDMFLRNQGAKLLDWGKQFVALLIDLVQNKLPPFIEKVQSLTEYFSQHQAMLYVVAGAIVGALLPAIFSAVAAFATLAIALAPWIIGGAIIGGIIAGIVWIVQNWGMLKEKALEIWGAITAFISEKVSQVGEFLSSVWKGISDTVRAVWSGISAFFRGIWEAISAIFTFYVSFSIGMTIAMFKAMGIDIVAVLTSIKDFFVAVWTSISSFVTTTMTAFTGWIGSKMKETGEAWKVAWNGMAGFVGPVWNNIKNGVSSALSWISEHVSSWAGPIGKAFGSIWEGVKKITQSMMDSIKGIIKSMVNGMIDGINKLISSLNSVASKGASAVGLKSPSIPSIPHLASGGIVTSPTVALIGEAGPEAVVPLGRGVGAGVGGMSLTVVVYGDVTGQDLIDNVSKELVKLVKLSTAAV